ncbi:MAG: GNAT family N-acetyltransferase [bacterium]|nr:GNAT family N-acetyltransferase [bacterium]
MRLVLPNIKYKESYYSLVNSAIKNNDISEMGHAYKENETFNEMIKRLHDRHKGKNINNRDVPSSLFWIIEKNEIEGTIDLRHKLNDDYFYRFGHVAYYIKPTERQKGYGTKALSKALLIYKKHNIDKILITCLKDNIASQKIIEKNNGVFESEVFDKKINKYIKRFWIDTGALCVPKIAWLTTNQTCNNNCNWCYAKKML